MGDTAEREAAATQTERECYNEATDASAVNKICEMNVVTYWDK